MYLLYKDKSFISYGDCPGSERTVTFLEPIAIFTSKEKLEKYRAKYNEKFFILDLSKIKRDPQ